VAHTAPQHGCGWRKLQVAWQELHEVVFLCVLLTAAGDGHLWGSRWRESRQGKRAAAGGAGAVAGAGSCRARAYGLTLCMKDLLTTGMHPDKPMVWLMLTLHMPSISFAALGVTGLQLHFS
jgi:hypothetical protein